MADRAVSADGARSGGGAAQRGAAADRPTESSDGLRARRGGGVGGAVGRRADDPAGLRGRDQRGDRGGAEAAGISCARSRDVAVVAGRFAGDSEDGLGEHSVVAEDQQRAAGGEVRRRGGAGADSGCARRWRDDHACGRDMGQRSARLAGCDRGAGGGAGDASGRRGRLELLGDRRGAHGVGRADCLRGSASFAERARAVVSDAHRVRRVQRGRAVQPGLSGAGLLRA